MADSRASHRTLRAYTELAGPRAGELAMLPIHWGTFRLTDESTNDPPEWMVRLWREATYDADRLWRRQRGQTRRLLPGG